MAGKIIEIKMESIDSIELMDRLQVWIYETMRAFTGAA
jgi:hypothetical protein